MKKNIKKLSLKKEVVRLLSSTDLLKAAGGTTYTNSCHKLTCVADGCTSAAK